MHFSSIRTFSPTKEYGEHDLALHNRIHSLQFITPQHLEIPSKYIIEKYIDLAKNGKLKKTTLIFSPKIALTDINLFNVPFEKLQCILKCCKYIFDGLKEAFGKDKVPGVDDFLPGKSSSNETCLLFSIYLCNPSC
jgi:hypothetical protein